MRKTAVKIAKLTVTASHSLVMGRKAGAPQEAAGAEVGGRKRK